MDYANYNLSMKDRIRGALPPLPEKDPKQASPLVLAYIGDTVYDLYVRSYWIYRSSHKAHGLHMACAKMVCAAAQAKAYRKVADMLTEEEDGVFRRGRNAHMGTVPKHAAIADYRAATGMEALLGYLYLSGRDERINEIMAKVMEDEEDGVQEA